MAIAVDAVSQQGNQSGSTTTWSHTCTGSNLLLVVGVKCDSGVGAVTGVTYNGVSLTQIGAISNGGQTDVNTYLFALLNPATGTHDIVVSMSPAATPRAAAVSYTGVLQSGLPDSFNTGASTTTPLTISTTVVASNCWLVGCLSNANDNLTAGTGTTLREGDGVFGSTAVFDSNGIVGTGSQSLQAVATGDNSMGGVVMSIAPASSTTTSTTTTTTTTTTSSSTTTTQTTSTTTTTTTTSSSTTTTVTTTSSSTTSSTSTSTTTTISTTTTLTELPSLIRTKRVEFQATTRSKRRI